MLFDDGWNGRRGDSVGALHQCEGGSMRWQNDALLPSDIFAPLAMLLPLVQAGLAFSGRVVHLSRLTIPFVGVCSSGTCCWQMDAMLCCVTYLPFGDTRCHRSEPGWHFRDKTIHLQAKRLPLQKMYYRVATRWNAPMQRDGYNNPPKNQGTRESTPRVSRLLFNLFKLS